MQVLKVSLLLIPITIVLANMISTKQQDTIAIAQSTDHTILVAEGEGSLKIRRADNNRLITFIKNQEVDQITDRQLKDGDVIYVSGDITITVDCANNNKEWVVSPGSFYGVINGCSTDTRNPYTAR